MARHARQVSEPVTPEESEVGSSAPVAEPEVARPLAFAVRWRRMTCRVSASAIAPAARTAVSPIVDAVVGFPLEVVKFVESLVTTFIRVITLSPFPSSNEPPQPSLLTAVLDVINREFRRFFNPTPSAGSTVLTMGSEATSLTVDVLDIGWDDGPVTLIGVTQPEHGTVSIDRDGTVTYTPHENCSGTD